MRSSRPARLLAPLALVAAALAVLLVVQSGGSTPTSSSLDAAPSTQTSPRSTTTTTTTAAQPRSYTIKAGDTLSGIAASTGISLSRIQALNPNVDAGALRTGQKLKLAP
jgi:LysM repeat protein